MSYQFKFPDVGEGLHEAEIVRWLVKKEDVIKADDPVVEVQTDKSVVEISSPVAGKVVSLAGEEGKVIHVGDVLITIDETGKSSKEDSPQKESKSKQEVKAIESKTMEYGIENNNKPPRRVRAAPTVRKLARQLGVNIEEVVGTGPSGRVIEEDVRNFSQTGRQAETITENHSTVSVHPSFDIHSTELIEEIPFRGLKRKISEKMVQSVYTIPHATGMGEFDVTKLVEFRNSLKPFAEKHGCKLTYLPFIIKAVTKALIENPYLNSSLDTEKEKIILKKYYNIGIATATKGGLVVPVIKNADKKSIIEIALELDQLSNKAREGKLLPKHMQGGTFTISSTGNMGGGTYATPIINYPEAAILGIYKIEDKPAVVDGEIVIRKMMGNALSFDHRIMDGLEVGLFMNSLTEILENPESLLLEVR